MRAVDGPRVARQFFCVEQRGSDRARCTPLRAWLRYPSRHALPHLSFGSLPPCLGGTQGLAQDELRCANSANGPHPCLNGLPVRCAANATGFDPAGGALQLLGRTGLAPAQAPAVSALPGPWQQQGASKALWPSGAPVAPLAPMPVLSGGCVGRFVPPVARHVDPFGMRQLLDLWPKGSTSSVRPRPWPLGPAYNSSEFNVFINTTYVVLVWPLLIHCAQGAQ